MLMLLINTYTPCVDYSPYQSNVLSDVIMCLITSCVVSDVTYYVRIQVRPKSSFVLLYFFLEKPSSFLLMENISSYFIIILFAIRQLRVIILLGVFIRVSVHENRFVLQFINTPTPNHWC